MDITELYAARPAPRCRQGPVEGAGLPAGVGGQHRAVITALQSLAPRQREVLVLRYWSHLSEAEIAQTLNISQGTVKSTASRALVALQKSMGEEER